MKVTLYFLGLVHANHACAEATAANGRKVSKDAKAFATNLCAFAYFA